MATDIGRIRGIIDLEDLFTTKLTAAGARLDKFGDKISKLGKDLLPISAAVAAIGVGILALGSRGAAVDDVSSAFERLTSKIGETGDEMLTALRSGVKGTLSDFELMKSANRALGAGLVATPEQMSLLSSSARLLGKQIGSDTATSFETLSRAIATGRVMSLRALGVFIDQRKALEDYAVQIGKTEAEFTDLDRTAANQIAIFEALGKFMDEAGVPAADFGERIEQVKTSLFNFFDEVAVGVSRNEGFLRFLDTIGNLVEEKLIPAARSLVGFIMDLADVFGTWSETTQLVVVGIGALVAGLGPGLIALGSFVKVVGFAAGGVGTLTTALGGIGPILAVVATGIAAFKLTEWVIEWLGARDALDKFFASLLSVKEELPPSKQQVDLMTRASELAGRPVRDWSEAIKIVNEDLNRMRREAGAPEIGEFSGKVEKSTETVKQLSEAAFNLVKTLGKEGLVSETNILIEALEEMNSKGNELSESGIAQVNSSIDSLIKNGLDPLAEKLLNLAGFIIPQVTQRAFELQAVLPGIEGGMQLVSEQIENQTGKWIGLIAQPPRAAGAFNAANQKIKTGTEESIDIVGIFGDTLSEIRGLFDLLGIEADSTAGRIVNAFSRVFDMFNSILGIVGKVIGIISGGGGGIGGGGIGGSGFSLGGLLGGLFGGGGGGIATPAVGSAVGTGGLGGIGGGGALSGLGGSIGGALSGLGSSIGAFAAAAGPFAPIAIGVIFGIRAMLKKASAETTAGAIGIEFDALSQSLKDRIQQMGEELGDFASAFQLNLGDLIAEGVISDPNEIAERLADTFSFLERGDITGEQASALLGENVQTLLGNLDQLGSSGTAQVERLLRAAADTGIEFQGLGELVNEFAKVLLGQAQAGGEAFLNQMNELGVTGRDSLAFLKNFAEEAGIELDVLDKILEVLGENKGPEKVGKELEDEISGGVSNSIEEVNRLLEKLDELERKNLSLNLGANTEGSPADIPGMAHGGLVRAHPPLGTLVRLGEREDEMVIPTSRLRQNVVVNMAMPEFADRAFEQHFLNRVLPVFVRRLEQNSGGAADNIADAISSRIK